jgi:hypothetical protein
LDVELSFPIGDAVHFGALKLDHFKQLAEEIGLPSKLAEKEVSMMVKSIEKTADELLHEFEVKQVPINLRAAQLSMIRSIRYIPIAEMANKLKQA